MMFLRIFLAAGLIFHKALWIAMRRRRPADRTPARKGMTPTVWLAKSVKAAILIAIFAQIFMNNVLPILDQPLALRIIGMCVYTVGLTMAVMGRVQLRDNWSDIEVGNIADDHLVVDTGIYRFLRHPIYVGDLLLLIGLELALNSWLVLVALALVPPVLMRAVGEERALRKALRGYDEYARRTKRFIPFIV